MDTMSTSHSNSLLKNLGKEETEEIELDVFTQYLIATKKKFALFRSI